MPNRRSIASLAFVTVTLALAALPAAARQAAPPPAGPEAGPPPQAPEARPGRGQRNARGGESMSIGAAMKTMDRSLDRLRTLVGDPSKTDEALALLGEIERGCLAAKNQPAPREVLERATDDAARAALAAEYRKDLIETMRILLEAEEALLARDVKRAGDSLTRVSELQKASHERFGVKEH